MLESQLLRAIARRLNALHQTDPSFVWRKRHGSVMGITGDPDLYGVWRGVPWQIELKIPGESPTPLQTHRLEEWSHAGAYTFVVHSMAELERALSQIPRGSSV
jgi:hypothetical protein